MKLKKIKEGRIELFVPESDKVSKKMSVFYNPKMEFNRNVSVSVLSVFQKKEKLKVCDALAATGVRGLRYAKELFAEVILNDKNPLAVELIKKNIGLNKLKAETENKDANILLSEKIFSVVDIDPFGSPSPFLDSAAKSVFWKGLLCVTATDTSLVSYPNASLRKYGIKSIKTDYYNELGLRIILSSIILNCAKYEKAFVPVLCFSKQHYYRFFGKIERGVKKVNEVLNKFGFVMHCFNCGNRKYGELEIKCECGKRFEICGPLYLEDINNKEFLEKVIKECEKRNFLEEAIFLRKMLEEDSLFYYDLHYFAKLYKIELPKIDLIIEKLKKKGFNVSRTHFCLTGIKTNANFEEIRNILNKNNSF